MVGEGVRLYGRKPGALRRVLGCIHSGLGVSAVLGGSTG